MIIVRKSTLGDAKDFAKLLLISAPYFPILFGSKIAMVLRDLFKQRSNLFSFEHVYFAEANGENAGMILGYDWRSKKIENLRTGLLLFKNVGVGILFKFLSLMRLNTTVGNMNKGEYYISNIVTYLQYRRMGIGKRLILQAEEEAKTVGAERIVLDVEKENINAVNFTRTWVIR